MEKRASDEWLESQINAYGTLGGDSETASALKELQRLRSDQEIASLKQRASAWDALYSSIEALREPEVADAHDKPPDATLNAYIEVYRRLKSEIQSTRQQLTALRDKWRASAESSIRIIAASNMPETFPAARATAEALSAAADELDSILKGAHGPQPLTESEG